MFCQYVNPIFFFYYWLF